MLRWVIILAIVAGLAWLFAFHPLAVAAAWLAKAVLFATCVIFVVYFVRALMSGGRPRSALRGGLEATERAGAAAEQGVARAVRSVAARADAERRTI